MPPPGPAPIPEPATPPVPEPVPPEAPAPELPPTAPPPEGFPSDATVPVTTSTEDGALAGVDERERDIDPMTTPVERPARPPSQGGPAGQDEAADPDPAGD